MSDKMELISGIMLLLVSLGSLVALYPRDGKPIWWIKTPFVGPSVAILIVTGVAIAAIMLASYFTNIDDVALSGKFS